MEMRDNEDREWPVRIADPSEVVAIWEALDSTFEPRLSSRIADFGSYLRKLEKLAMTAVCEEGDVVAGAVSLYANDGESRAAFVTQLAVAPSWQGRRIGSKLMEFAILVAQAMGMRSMRLEVRNDNKAALRLYEGLGFSPITARDETMILERAIERPSPLRSDEIGRILDKGFVDESFLLPEVRSNFYVDEKRKRVWLVELDLLRELAQVLEKHGLRWSLGFGTLLGAVRHGGFVPWDDDIDVLMPRGDYERLRGLGHEFSEPYFLQYPGGDEDYYFSYAKLRNSRTSGVSNPFVYRDFNQGIPIDIFPVDDFVCDGDADKDYETFSRLVIDLSNYMRQNNPHPTEQEAERMAAYSGVPPAITLARIEGLARKYEGGGSPLCSTSTLTVYERERMIFRKEWFEESVAMGFEGIEVPIPTGFERILETTYGCWNELPPIRQRGLHHSSATFAPDVPYMKTVSEMRRETGLAR